MRRKSQRAVELTVLAPTAGVITRIPTNQPDRESKRALQSGKNIRCMDGALQNAPGCMPLPIDVTLKGTPNLIHNGNITNSGGFNVTSIPVLATDTHIYAVTKEVDGEPPNVYAGADNWIVESNTAVLHGFATDPSGLTLTYAWTVINKPFNSTCLFEANKLDTVLVLENYTAEAVPGPVTMRLTATNSAGVSAYDEVVIHYTSNDPIQYALVPTIAIDFIQPPCGGDVQYTTDQGTYDAVIVGQLLNKYGGAYNVVSKDGSLLLTVNRNCPFDGGLKIPDNDKNPITGPGETPPSEGDTVPSNTGNGDSGGTHSGLPFNPEKKDKGKGGRPGDSDPVPVVVPPVRPINTTKGDTPIKPPPVDVTQEYEVTDQTLLAQQAVDPDPPTDTSLESLLKNYGAQLSVGVPKPNWVLYNNGNATLFDNAYGSYAIGTWVSNSTGVKITLTNVVYRPNHVIPPEGTDVVMNYTSGSSFNIPSCPFTNYWMGQGITSATAIQKSNGTAYPYTPTYFNTPPSPTRKNATIVGTFDPTAPTYIITPNVDGIEYSAGTLVFSYIGANVIFQENTPLIVPNNTQMIWGFTELVDTTGSDAGFPTPIRIKNGLTANKTAGLFNVAITFLDIHGNYASRKFGRDIYLDQTGNAVTGSITAGMTIKPVGYVTKLPTITNTLLAMYPGQAVAFDPGICNLPTSIVIDEANQLILDEYGLILDPQTGILAGTCLVTVAGTKQVTIAFSNDAGLNTGTITLQVNTVLPDITTTEFSVPNSVSSVITLGATGSPTKWGFSNASDAGLTFECLTGKITCNIATPGVYTIDAMPLNAFGSGTTKTITITVT